MKSRFVLVRFLGFCLPITWPFFQKPNELVAHNCLTLSTSEAFNLWNFQGKDKQYQIQAYGNFTTDNVEALYDYACMGGGIIRLSDFMVKETIDQGTLVPLLTNFETDQQVVHIIYAHRKFLPVKIRAFVDFMLENLRLSS